MEDRESPDDRPSPTPNNNKHTNIRKGHDRREGEGCFLDTGEGQASTLSPALSPEAAGFMIPWLAGF